jgi:parallel beta-helix repeat protein
VEVSGGRAGAPIITSNVINKNSAFGGTGGGIELDGTYGGPQIIANVIENNTAQEATALYNLSVSLGEGLFLGAPILLTFLLLFR